MIQSEILNLNKWRWCSWIVQIMHIKFSYKLLQIFKWEKAM